MVATAYTYLQTKISQKLLVLNFTTSHLNYIYRLYFSDAVQLHRRLSVSQKWSQKAVSPSHPANLTLAEQI